MTLPKKGDLSDCNNWRSITLLSIPGKVFCTVLLNRLREHVDSRLREEQAGFRKRRSCSEQIFTLRTIIEQSLEHQTPLIINFIDFKKAFDSIHRESLWKILKLYGVPDKFIDIFKTLYLNSSCCVKTSVGNTDMFDIKTGVRQSCILSPFLILITIDFVMTKAMDDASFGIEWSQKRLADLDFADDISAISHTLAGIHIGKGVRQRCILSPLLFNIYTQKHNQRGFGRMGEGNQHRREDGDEPGICRRHNTARWDQGRLGRTCGKRQASQWESRTIPE